MWPLLRLMEMYNDNEFSFMSEMQNDPKNLSELAFDTDSFNYWSDEFSNVDALLKGLGEGVQFYGGCDPALGKSLFTGDYSAIVILACKGDDTYIIVSDIARRSPDRLIKDIIAYAKRYNFSKFVIESNNFQELMVQSLERSAHKEGLQIPIERVNNATRKTDRIFSLYYWVKNGIIRFSRNDKMILDQFRAFPQQGKSDDGLDALEMAFKVLQRRQVCNQDMMLKCLRQFNGKPDTLKSNMRVKYIVDPFTGRRKCIDDPFGLL
jgi:predicted phage terminase large subunit-like protein